MSIAPTTRAHYLKTCAGLRAAKPDLYERTNLQSEDAEMKTYKVKFVVLEADGGQVETVEIKADHIGVDPTGHLILARGVPPQPEIIRVFAPGRWRECELVEAATK